MSTGTARGSNVWTPEHRPIAGASKRKPRVCLPPNAAQVYARADLGCWALRYGVTLNLSNMRANDGDACSRAVLTADTTADAAAIALALYRAIWSEGRTPATRDDVLGAIGTAGIDAAPITERIDLPEIIARLDANTDEAAARGVFGSPTVFVGEAMFFCNDWLDFVREELAHLEEAA